MKRILLIISMILLLNISIVSAHEHDFAGTKQFIDSGISCDKLTDEQLEAIGDYYMEQMHPGEAHEIMDNMMGGEDSESLKQVHINMARRLYCNDDVYIGYGMMDSGGMMNGNMMDLGMMGTSGFGYWNVINILYVLLLIGIIVLVYFWIIRLWKDMKKKSSRKT